jgi:hypothetical protein
MLMASNAMHLDKGLDTTMADALYGRCLLLKEKKDGCKPTDTAICENCKLFYQRKHIMAMWTNERKRSREQQFTIYDVFQMDRCDMCDRFVGATTKVTNRSKSLTMHVCIDCKERMPTDYPTCSWPACKQRCTEDAYILTADIAREPYRPMYHTLECARRGYFLRASASSPLRKECTPTNHTEAASK